MLCEIYVVVDEDGVCGCGCYDVMIFGEVCCGVIVIKYFVFVYYEVVVYFVDW